MEFALALPGAWEDHPWDEVVVKVDKKVDVPFRTTLPPVGVLTDMVEESYRLVALKRRVAELDESAPPR